ncbi:MAG: ABC transporter permease subunit [Treponema sp.]|nr:ABC transporter permease subunit [Treponema sp.]
MKTRFLSLTIAISFFCALSLSCSRNTIVRDSKNSATTGKEAVSGLSENIPPQFQNVTLKYNSKEELQQSDRLVLGMHTGFVMVDKLTRELFPQAKIEYYKTNADMAYLVSSGKLDGFINDEPVIRYAALEVPKLGYIHCGLDTMNIVACFQKNEKGAALRDEFNQYVRKWQADGTLKKTDDLWLSRNEEKKVVDLESLQNPNGKKGTLRFATSAECPPFDYIKDGNIVGYEIDLIARFCKEAGYALTVQDVPFDSLIMGLETNMYDCVAACLSDTPAIKESLNISEAIYVSELVMAVQILDDEAHAKKALAEYTPKNTAPKQLSLSDFNSPNVTLGIKTGTIADVLTNKLFPLAKKENYNAYPEMIFRTAQGKIDGYLIDEPTVRYMERENPAITHMEDLIVTQDYAFAFPKTERGKKLRSQMDEFLRTIKADDTIREIDSIWFGSDESLRTVDLTLSGENGIVTLVTESTNPPFTYIKNNSPVGYEIDIAARFCREYGYGLKIIDTTFPALLTGIVSGIYDMGAGVIAITEERKENIDFSEPDYQGGIALAVKKTDEHRLSDLNKTSTNIGVQTGTVFDNIAAQAFPKAKVRYYSVNIDMAKLVAQGRLDCVLVDEPTAKLLCANIKELDYIKDYVEKTTFSFAFSKTKKGDVLRKQMDEFIHKSRKTGLFQELENIWFGDDENKKTIDMSSLSAKNGTIRLATNAEYAPFEYIKNGAITGYDIDWAVRFAREYGYGLEIADMNFDSVIPSVASEKFDFAAAGLSVTEERKQSVSFSLPNYEGGVVAVVKSVSSENMGSEAQTAEKSKILVSLASSFEKTFVRESRWQLVLHGIFITVLISILSAIFGTILGFGFCALRLSKNSLLNGTALVYIRLMQGLPMVVLLMILFYLVFAKTGLSGIWVAVIGFGMNFGAYVSEMIRTGILAVDKGQMEAALALGYPKSKAFVKMILPQAAQHFLPVYQGEFISLVKMTSVVGYIAIQDLTKASDIIRSRTYEAFFPLITTAILYFIISWLLTRALSALQTRIDPKKRRR